MAGNTGETKESLTTVGMLEGITSPTDVKKLSVEELDALAEEIRELLALDAGHDRARARARALARSRIARLDAQIAEMMQARDYLQTLARECSRNAKGPCPILASFAG